MANEKYISLLDFLMENEEKLKIFLSAKENIKAHRYQIKGKKSSRTVFMSQSLQFVMNEYCIENDLKIGEFVELAIIEQLCRLGYEKKLSAILQCSDEGKQGKTAKSQVEKGKNAEERTGD